MFPPMEFVGNVSGTEGSSGRVSLSNTLNDGLGPAERNIHFTIYNSVAYLAYESPEEEK